MRNFDEINAILEQLAAERMIEPIDDPSVMVDFYDYADVVGLDVDEWMPEEYNA